MKRLKKQPAPAGVEMQSGAPQRFTDRSRRFFLSVSSTMTTLFLTTSAAMATTKTKTSAGLFGKIGDILNEFYGEFVSISTIVTVLVIIVCLLLMQVAEDDNGKRWLRRAKRAALCWCIIMILGSIVAFGEDLFSGMQYKTS